MLNWLEHHGPHCFPMLAGGRLVTQTIIYHGSKCVATNMTTNLAAGTITVLVEGTYQIHFSGSTYLDNGTSTQIRLRRTFNDGIGIVVSDEAFAFTRKDTNQIVGTLTISLLKDCLVNEIYDVYIQQGEMANSSCYFFNASYCLISF